jgi:hypothetical protein
MSTATLDGHRVTSARLHLPAWGVWWAEVKIDQEATVSGRVPLVIADLRLTGTIVSGGPGPLGRAAYRLAGGAAGWGKAIPARSYANDAGLKASAVIADAATACGETLDAATLPTTRLGPAFVREAAPAARVLEQVVPAGWYVAEDGTTKIGKRAATTLETAASVLSVDRALGTVSLAADSIAGIVPGVTVESVEAVDVLHELGEGAGPLRSTLWGAGIASSTRRLVAWRRIYDQLDPRRRYRGLFEYRVVTQDGERLNLQPIRVSIGMPDLQRVPVRPGVTGCRADVALGSRVLVTFIEADPARPFVLAFEDAEGDGFVPLKLEIDATTELDLGEGALLTKIAGGVLASARQTDIVQAGPFLGTIIGPCSTKVRVG